MADLISPQPERPFSPMRHTAEPLEQFRSRLQPAVRYIRSRATAQRTASAHYAPWFRQLRQWSPGVMPPIFGSLLLLAAALLATRRTIGQHPLIAPNTLLPLFLFYLLGGLLWGYLLYIAPSVASWFCLVAGGAATYLMITAALIGGLPGVVLVGALLAGAVVLYVRRHLATIPNSALQLTTSAGGYSRLLQPGVTILLPGERVGRTLQTEEREYDSPLQRAEVQGESGTIYSAQASATVGYRIAPIQLHHVAPDLEHWEDDTHQAIQSALRQALAEWGKTLVAAEGEVPEGVLTKTMLALLREWGREYGVRIMWIRAHDMWLTPASETIPADEWQAGIGDTETTLPSSRTHTYESVSLSRTQALPSIDHVEQARPAPSASPPVPREALAPQALSDAYEAVREGHILDPWTIREVANAFLRVASDAELNSTFPYDALGAARILLERATALERSSNSRTRANSDFLC